MVKAAVQALAAGLTPPGIDSYSWWRLIVSGTLFALVIVVALHIADSAGVLWGSGFAHADELSDVKRLQLEERLDRIHTLICMADEGEITQDTLEQVRTLEAQYREVNDDVPYRVNCDLLVKLRQ